MSIGPQTSFKRQRPAVELTRFKVFRGDPSPAGAETRGVHCLKFRASKQLNDVADASVAGVAVGSVVKGKWDG